MLTPWTTACPDWQERIVARQSLIPFAPLFPAEADAALAVFSELRMTDVAGSPRLGEICLPWITDIVASVFGAYDANSGRRLVTEWLLSVAKKNSKSSSAAGLMLTALIRNWRESAEFLILAPTVEIANNSFFPARDMVRKDEELSDLLQVQDHIRTITHRGTGATLKVVAADSDTVGGKKATGVLVDELWLFGKQPGAENMLREACGGLASRPEGFTIFLTTQSDSPPAGVFKQKLLYARQVRDGKVDDPRFVPILYEFPEKLLVEGKHREKEYFYVTNPNLGSSVDEEFLTRELKKAEVSGEESVRGFLSKHLNVEIGLALRSDRWVGADYWERNGNPTLAPLDEVLRRSDVLEVGIDGGGLDDLLGLAVLGRCEKSGQWLVWVHAWIHPIALERRKSEAARWKDFERDGDLTISKEIGDDVRDVAEIVSKVYASGLMDKIGVDAVGIGAILDELEERGIPSELIVAVSQGWKMSGAIKTTERRLAEGTMKHGGSALMAWSVSNCKVEPRGNAITITKQAAGFAKIDPVMALFNAVSLMSVAPEAQVIGSDYVLMTT